MILAHTSRRLACSSVAPVVSGGSFRGSSGAYHLSTSFNTSLKYMSSVAFVGLGNMGRNMAMNLARNKPSVVTLLTVHDSHEPTLSSFMEQAKINGLSVSSTPNLASFADSNPDVIITSLPSCEASVAVVGEIVESLSPSREAIFIDTSTISVTTSRKLHELVTSTSTKFDYVDAPVSGGVKGATDASLTFMVGCSSLATLSSVQPILQRMGKDIIPCGGPGSGSAVKLCNNAALAAQMLGVCEAMNLGDKLGVDPAVLAGVMNVSTAKSWSSTVNNPHPVAARGIGSGASANEYEGGFGTSLMLKDLNLAIDTAEEEHVSMPVTSLARELYRIADSHGYGKKDFGVMLQFLRGRDGSGDTR